jgi:uncharacterized membrane-anchored protein YitT (DUF2179 family)
MTNIFNVPQDQISALLMFIYAVAYGLAISLCYAIIYIVGGCTAGLDFVSIYYATRKDKNLGFILTIFNGASMLLGSILGSYISGGIVCPIV